MQIFKKEKKVVELALEHAEKTGECLAIMSAVVKASATNNIAELEAAANKVNKIETEADELLRNIRNLLYSGAYLPTIRGDLYRLLSAVDSITNRAEGCLEFISSQHPANVRVYLDEFGDILDMTVDCYDNLHVALQAFFRPKGEIDELRARSRAVGEIESAIDERERALTVTIFSSDLPLAEKMHLAETLSRITRISDQIENTADELELLSLKSII